MKHQLFNERVKNNNGKPFGIDMLGFAIKDTVGIRESSHGKGVFAMKDLEANEVVTMYPEHAKYKRGEDHYTSSFDIQLSKDTFWEYSLNMEDGSVIYGDPKILVSGFLGHMINDSTTESERLKKCTIDEMVKESIKYKLKSIENDNCLLANKNGVGYVVTTKKIKKGDELFVSYGAVYWSEIKATDIDKAMKKYVDTCSHKQKMYLGNLFST